MKYLMLITLLLSQLQSTAYGEENSSDVKPKIMFETKIYRLLNDSSEGKGIATQIDNAVLEGSPSLLTTAGEKSSLEIGVGNDSSNAKDKIMLQFLPDAKGNTFDVKLELLDGSNTVISHIEDAAIGQQLNFSAKLNDVTRLFSLTATQVSANGGNELSVAKDSQANAMDEGQCGRVSVFFQPPRNERYFAAGIYKINDNNVDITKTTHQLPIGKQTIFVTASTKRYRGRGKELEIDIKPNTNYHIGAKFISEKRYRTLDQENWEAVIWKKTEQACSL